MRSLNGRISRLEQAAAPLKQQRQNGRDYVVETLQTVELTIRTIDAGLIYDWPATDAFKHNRSPAAEHESSAFFLLFKAQNIVEWWAKETGWTSPTAKHPIALPQTKYQANNTAELLQVLEWIKEDLTAVNEGIEA